MLVLFVIDTHGNVDWRSRFVAPTTIVELEAVEAVLIDVDRHPEDSGDSTTSPRGFG